MMNEEKILRGEVYYITSRFDNTVGSEQKGGRPAVIVSNNANNEFSPCVEICYMTLQEKKPLPTHVFINRGSCINSTVLCEQITTISKERIGDYMCTLSDEVMEAVDEALMTSLGLDYMFSDEEDEGVPCDYSADPTVADLQAQNRSLEAQVKELIHARDLFRDRAEKAESLSKEAETYKNLYNELLDRIMRR